MKNNEKAWFCPNKEDDMPENTVKLPTTQSMKEYLKGAVKIVLIAMTVFYLAWGFTIGDFVASNWEYDQRIAFCVTCGIFTGFVGMIIFGLWMHED